jgi:RHS repeat-associated protein
LTRTHLAGTANAVAETWTYNAMNLVATSKNGLNLTTTFTYDTIGRLTSVKNPLNQATSFTYNSAGQPLTVKDPRGKTTTFTYDLFDLRSIKNPLSQTTTFQTDVLGRRTVTVNPLGNRTYVQYDVMDRVVRVTDAQGNATSMSYDAIGNLTVVTDARGNARTFTYDPLQRIATARDALLRTDSYLYDVAGNAIRFTDRKGQVTTYIYDALNRRTQATYNDSTKTQWTYDAGNRIALLRELSATNVVLSSIGRTWDGLDRLTQESTGEGTVSYAYDKAHRRTAQTVTDQPSLAYTYDNASRLTKIQQGSGSQVTYTYDAAGRVTTSTLANGIVATYTYDDANQLTGISYANGATIVGDLTYTYDAGGRRIAQSGSLHESFLPAATTADAVFDANNKLTQHNGINYAYDNNGSLTSDGTRTYVWDNRNRLKDIKQGTTTIATFQYDAAGRRRLKTVSGATTKYLYDGLNAVQELSSTNAPLANIVAGGLDQWLWRTDATGNKHFLNDALSSTRALADDGKAITTRYQYEPYGETTYSAAASSNSSQYTGRENDGTGLYYYRARYYHPTLKRFIAEDPIGLEGGINYYAYVSGNPLSYMDPEGLQYKPPKPDWMKPITDARYCRTSECAAGVLPDKSPMRTPEQEKIGMCRLVCNIVTAPATLACNVAAGGGIIGGIAFSATRTGACYLVCQ